MNIKKFKLNIRYIKYLNFFINIKEIEADLKKNKNYL